MKNGPLFLNKQLFSWCASIILDNNNDVLTDFKPFFSFYTITSYLSWPDKLYFYCFISLNNLDQYDHYAACCVLLTACFSKNCYDFCDLPNKENMLSNNKKAVNSSECPLPYITHYPLIPSHHTPSPNTVYPLVKTSPGAVSGHQGDANPESAQRPMRRLYRCHVSPLMTGCHG